MKKAGGHRTRPCVKVVTGDGHEVKNWVMGSGSHGGVAGSWGQFGEDVGSTLFLQVVWGHMMRF